MSQLITQFLISVLGTIFIWMAVEYKREKIYTMSDKETWIQILLISIGLFLYRLSFI